MSFIYSGSCTRARLHKWSHNPPTILKNCYPWHNWTYTVSIFIDIKNSNIKDTQMSPCHSNAVNTVIVKIQKCFSKTSKGRMTDCSISHENFFWIFAFLFDRNFIVFCFLERLTSQTKLLWIRCSSKSR